MNSYWFKEHQPSKLSDQPPKKHTYILRYLMTTQTDFESMRVFKSHQGPSFDGGAILTSHESLSVTLKCLKYATHAHEQS